MIAGSGALACLLVIPGTALGVNGSYLAVVALTLAAGTLVALSEDRDARLVSGALLVWALLLRCAALICCFAWAAAQGGPFLGPDSTLYFDTAHDLARRGFQLDALPVIAFGTYDVGQFYLFAAGIRWLHADLFGLQTINCGLTALAAPLAYGAARVLVPRGAIWIGLLVAVHPTLIALSSIDLLKDPSIVCALAALVWALVRIIAAHDARAIAGFAAVALVAACYLRVSRFYTFTYVEAGFVAAMAVAWRARTRLTARRMALAVIVGVFLLTEGVPARAKWPPTPVLFLSMASYTLDTPALRAYAPGLFDRLRVGGAGGTGGEQAAPDWRAGLLTLPANMFRRVFGPFPWIAPADWHFKVLQDGQYYLFPGMLVWYALLPAIVAGLGLTAVRMWRREESRTGLVMLWFFVVIYFAQYLTINLSYRQRDVTLPVLLIFGWIGLTWGREISRARIWYSRYWAVLCVIAGTHILVRAFIWP